VKGAQHFIPKKTAGQKFKEGRSTTQNCTKEGQ